MSEVTVWLEPGHEKRLVSAETVLSGVLTELGQQNYPCGGMGKCGKCRVLTQGGAPPTEVERAVLTQGELAQGWRLSCVSPVRPGMRVWLPGHDEQTLRILGAEGAAVFPEEELTAEAEGYRLGCDLGTTTVVLYLLHPKNGAVLHTVSALNDQVAFGGDVISRIFAVCEAYDRLEALQTAVAGTINRLIGQIAGETGVTKDRICELRVAGNTTMEHLLIRADPRGLGKSPFVPAFLSAAPQRADVLGLDLLPFTPVTLVPNLSAFVGGDITAGIYYTGMSRGAELSLLLDIGTNNEMVVGNSEQLYACSAAAGPALEGAQISTGMRAAAGAVESVWLEDGRLCLRTIQSAPPRGLCGSGLIDLLALLVREGILLPNGCFAEAGELPDGDLSGRLQKAGRRHSEFVYCRRGEYGADQELALTQKDVREAQLAKSAISVGIDKLLERVHATARDLKRVYLAGAFGNYIDQNHARELGILPPVGDEVIQAVHNSAGLGVCGSLYDPTFQTQLEHITDIYHSINLAAEDDFQKRFLARLQFTL